MQNSKLALSCVALVLALNMVTSISASAMPAFLEEFKLEYPSVVGTRLDSCDVCHGSNFPRRNPYGLDFNLAGRRFPPIEPIDSDGDGVPNLTEIEALTFPGDASDYPGAQATPTATAIPTRTPGASCPGDCNGDGVVTINELILAVNIGLGLANVDQCPAADVNDDGQVTVNEVVTAVNFGQNGCP